MVFSRILLREFSKLSLKINSRLQESTTSIDLLTIWSLKLSRVMVVLYGHAKTTTEMFNLTSSPKVLDLLVS